MIRTGKWFPLVLSTLFLMACVTINVYFPAAAAEKAADRIIEEVYGKQPGAEEPPVPKAPTGQSEPGMASTRVSQGITTFLHAVLDIVVPPAHAQADINIDTPTIRAITASMSRRQSQLDAHYASGAIGMTTDGLITIRDSGAVPLKDRNTLKQLVADDNRDRNALYREVANANGHPEWEADIRKTFAERWVANAPGGWWYQDAGGWKRK